jgi:hypothetical protein
MLIIVPGFDDDSFVKRLAVGASTANLNDSRYQLRERFASEKYNVIQKSSLSYARTIASLLRRRPTRSSEFRKSSEHLGTSRSAFRM